MKVIRVNNMETLNIYKSINYTNTAKGIFQDHLFDDLIS